MFDVKAIDIGFRVSSATEDETEELVTLGLHLLVQKVLLALRVLLTICCTTTP